MISYNLRDNRLELDTNWSQSTLSKFCARPGPQKDYEQALPYSLYVAAAVTDSLGQTFFVYIFLSGLWIRYFCPATCVCIIDAL